MSHVTRSTSWPISRLTIFSGLSNSGMLKVPRSVANEPKAALFLFATRPAEEPLPVRPLMKSLASPLSWSKALVNLSVNLFFRTLSLKFFAAC